MISTCALRSAFTRSIAAPGRFAGDVVAKPCAAILTSAALQYCIAASATSKRHVFFGQANFLTRIPAHRLRPPHLGRRPPSQVGLRHDNNIVKRFQAKTFFNSKPRRKQSEQKTAIRCCLNLPVYSSFRVLVRTRSRTRRPSFRKYSRILPTRCSMTPSAHISAVCATSFSF